MPRLFFFVTLALCLARPCQAQDVPDDEAVRLSLGGTFQGRFSYGWHEGTAERLGFGMRRARLRLDAMLWERTGLYFQVDGADASVELLDVALSYRLGGGWLVRLGRFAGAQPRAYQLTSHTRIDALERAAIAERWGAGTLAADGRDFGVELAYASETTEALFFLHNGDGSWNRLHGNFRPAVDDPTGGADGTGLAVSAYGAYRPPSAPGLEVGGFVGYNGSRNPNTEIEEGFFAGTGRTYLSYSGHAYWGAAPGSQPLRLKADVIGIRYETLTLPPTADLLPGARLVGREQHALGVALLGAARLHPAGEVFARVEQYDPNLHAGGDRLRYLSAGGHFSLSALSGRPYRQQRLTLAYSLLVPEAGDAATRHLLALQMQIVF